MATKTKQNSPFLLSITLALICLRGSPIIASILKTQEKVTTGSFVKSTSNGAMCLLPGVEWAQNNFDVKFRKLNIFILVSQLTLIHIFRTVYYLTPRCE